MVYSQHHCLFTACLHTTQDTCQYDRGQEHSSWATERQQKKQNIYSEREMYVREEEERVILEILLYLATEAGSRMSEVMCENDQSDFSSLSQQ